MPEEGMDEEAEVDEDFFPPLAFLPKVPMPAIMAPPYGTTGGAGPP
jgi:hypothetical protein